MIISDLQALLKADSSIERLFERGDPAGAINFADNLRSSPGLESHVRNLRASTYARVGEQKEQIDLIEEAINIWRSAGDHITTHESYNLASSMLSIWHLHERQNGFADTWMERRDYLHESREIFSSIANNEEAETELRLKALTNAGNSYDNVGRNTDAFDCYDRALAIDSSFAMATGNRGLALLYASPYMRGFEREVKLRAAAELDIAIDDPESVLQHGGESALESFRLQRSLIPDVPSAIEVAMPTPLRFTDPHLTWCLREGLLLHVAPKLMDSSVSTLEPLFFRRIISSLDEADMDHMNEIIDAFNTIKQDFMSARYLVWACSEQSSPIRSQAQAITSHASFLDTLQYGRWGVRTGIAVQAFKATIDVLDKIASFTHLYFGTNQSARVVSFRNLPYEDNRQRRVAGAFLTALQGSRWNVGLAALIDLSYDLVSSCPSSISRNINVRHAATHRFVIVHTEFPQESSEWSERITWHDLIGESLFQLRLARSAIFYVAKMIDIHEEGKAAALAEASAIMPLTYSRLDTDLLESE
ncbi:MAG: LA2681 family HEPN domain-containing protein [Chloroflexi bacterium]|nr:LA2681 family HEPN domain-containing protein [Chloroflexota bacterium]